MTHQPNIFKYATSELSQDAFIAWLLEWADSSNKAHNEQLHQLGLGFLESLLAKQNIQLKKITALKIKTQFHKIDVFVSFEMSGKRYGIIIEDKVQTIDHNNQLERYKVKINELKITDVTVPIYFKTGYQVNLKSIIENKYHHYTVKDLLKVMTSKKVSIVNNALVSQYHSYILTKEIEFDEAEKDANAYKTAPLNEWKWWTCVRFFHEYKDHFKAGWGSVGNNREPLLAFWYGGKMFTMRDVETNQLIELEIYSDIQFSRNQLKLSYRIGLNKNKQQNNKNRNKIFDAFKPYLEKENIVYKKAHFKEANNTMKLVEVFLSNTSVCYEELVSVLEKLELLSKKFVNEFTDD